MSTIELILAIFSTLTTSGVITLFFFYRSKRRTAAAEAESAEHKASTDEFGALKMQIEFIGAQLENSFDVNEKQQKIIDSTRTLLREVQRKANDLELRLMQEQHARRAAEFHRCEADCPNRIPPRQFTITP